MLFANNVGTQYVHATFDGGSTVQDGVYQSVTCDPENQVLYIKLVNTSGKDRTVNVQLDGYKPMRFPSKACKANLSPPAMNWTAIPRRPPKRS